MSRQNRIERTLKDAFSPSALEVIDESHMHAGHAGARPEGETHYRVRIEAGAFDGKGRLERHRMVNAALAGEFDTGLHALAIDARSPA